MSIATNEKTLTLNITPLAQEKIFELKTDLSNEENLSLRIYLEKLTCAGPKYNFAWDKIEQDDFWMDANGIKIIVDPTSFDYLQGSTLDYMQAGCGTNNGFILYHHSKHNSCCDCSCDNDSCH